MQPRRWWENAVVLWTWVPWVFLVWLGAVIACRRWWGLDLVISLTLSGAAGFCGWRLTWQWAERANDVAAALLLTTVPEPEPWARPHAVQRIKVAHLAHCQRRWGVNARSSGWRLMERAGRIDLAGVLICMALVVHAWWVLL